jgi:hypothetical protein
LAITDAPLGAEITAMAAASTAGISRLDGRMAVFRHNKLQMYLRFIVLIELVEKVIAQIEPII